MDAEDDTKSFLLNWEVPLRQFQVDTRLFRPLPALESPRMLTQLSQVTLEWTLTLCQTKTDARVTLNYQTRGIPNLGVQYVVMAYRRDDTVGKLTASLREALAKTGSKKSAASSWTSQSLKDAYLQTPLYIFNGSADGQTLTGDETVKVCVCVYINETRFHPKNIMANIINQYEQEIAPNNLRGGVVGSLLWAQSESGELCDVQFDCCGESIYAHSPILFAFSPHFADMIKRSGYKKNGWHLSSNGVRGDAVREVLYYMYNRRVSPQLSKAPLNEVLEASKLFGVPVGLKLEVERLLVLMVSPRNLAKMWRMSHTFGLKVIHNMVRTRCGNKSEVINELERLEEPPSQQKILNNSAIEAASQPQQSTSVKTNE